MGVFRICFEWTWLLIDGGDDWFIVWCLFYVRLGFGILLLVCLIGLAFGCYGCWLIVG